MDLIDETIQFGSVQLALVQEAFTVKDLITRLSHLPCDQSAVVAYRHACLLGTDEDQYIDNMHFLTKVRNEEYAAIFVLSGRHHRDGDTEVLKPLAIGLRRLSVDHKFSRYVRLICDDIHVSVVYNEDIPLLIKSHSSNLLNLILKSPDNFIQPTIEDYLSGDYLDCEIPPGGIKKILEHCCKLSTKANKYWVNVAMPSYTGFLQRNIEENGLDGLSRNSLKKLGILMPKLFPDIDLQSISDIGLHLLTLPTNVAAYYLGLPIHREEPDRTRIIELVKEISQIGVEQYADKMERLHKERCKTTISNETDVLHESMFRYGSFDRVTLSQKGHTFIFTRPEFPTLISSKRNHWNNTPLPVAFIEKLRYRQKVAFVMKLPKPLPLDQLLQSLLLEKREPITRDIVTPILPLHLMARLF
jgi:hypothetical protein